MQSIDSIKSVVAPIAKVYGIKKVYLFGSYAKGTANADSDVDILIEKGKPLSLLGLSGLLQDIKEALNLPVDIVTTASLKGEFREAIKGTEILIYEEQR